AHDLAVEYDAGGRMFARQGYRPGEVITHAHPAGLNGGAALLGGVIEAFGCLNVPVGPPSSRADAEAAVRLWLQLKPDRYEMFGSALHVFWETAQAMGLDPAADLRMPPPADAVPWRTVSAGIDCFAFLGSACDHANGAHICEDEAIVEAVDPASGEAVADGTRGHLVVTTLTRDNFMLRYDLQDLVRLDGSECPCGETHMRVFWDGRAADVVPVAGREILPIDVQVVLAGFPEIAHPALEFQLVRRAGATALDVRAEAASTAEPLRAAAAAALQDALGVPVDLTLLETGALPRPSYKPLRVVDG
ncbi:MAG: phenylacetate--CoA ligase family protein, partial [bacterium]